MIKFSANKLLQTAEGKQELDISFDLETGKLLTLYGDSGAGKTTVLRILAGLTDCTKAWIEMDGEIWHDTRSKKYLATRKRPIGMVFQDFALFPNLTVRENISFGLLKNEDKKEVDNLIELMELKDLQNSKPNILSGGQKQRVAIARAIIRKPKILLLDEPFAALDSRMQGLLQNYVKNFQQQNNLTAILVTHHLPELFKLSDEVLIIEKGKIKKRGTPHEIFLDKNNAGEFKLTGEIIGIKNNGIHFTVTILAFNNIVDVEVGENEIADFFIGAEVFVSLNGFKTVIQKKL